MAPTDVRAQGRLQRTAGADLRLIEKRGRKGLVDQQRRGVDVIMQGAGIAPQGVGKVQELQVASGAN